MATHLGDPAAAVTLSLVEEVHITAAAVTGAAAVTAAALGQVGLSQRQQAAADGLPGCNMKFFLWFFNRLVAAKNELI